MTITSEWVHRYATRNGGWTKKQLTILGVAWPPRRGWLRSMVGREITDEQRAAFEHIHEQRKPRRSAKQEKQLKALIVSQRRDQQRDRMRYR